MEIQQLADKRNVDVDINKISNDITVVGLKDDVRQLRDKINTILYNLSGNINPASIIVHIVSEKKNTWAMIW